MLNSVSANFYERDIRKLIEEISLFGNEEDLGRTQGSVKNSGGRMQSPNVSCDATIFLNI